MITIPENKFNEGWETLVAKIEHFILREPGVQGKAGSTGQDKFQYIKEEGSFKDSRNKKHMNTSMPSGENDLLDMFGGQFPWNWWYPYIHRCNKMGLADVERSPESSGVWYEWDPVSVLSSKLRKLQNVFLWEIGLDKGSGWCLNGGLQNLELPQNTKNNWFWIWVLGLSLHLWSSKVMNYIGNKCGSWLENELETKLKNHLRGAHIRVKGPREQILPSVEVADGEWIFSLSVWCESLQDIEVGGWVITAVEETTMSPR